MDDYSKKDELKYQVKPGGSKSVGHSLLEILRDLTIVSVVVASVIWAAWTLPENRPSWLPDLQGALALFSVTSVWLTALVYGMRTGAVGAAIRWCVNCLSKVGLGGWIIFAVFVLGLFVSEKVGLAPPMQEWPSLSTATISFFAIYIPIFVLAVLWLAFVRNATKRAAEAETRGDGHKAVLRYLRPYILALAVPLYISGMFVSQWLGLGSPFSFDGLFDTGLWGYLAIYTVLFSLLPVALFLLGWFLVLAGGWLAGLFRGIGRTETWRRMKGVPLSDAELQKELKGRRAERDKIKQELAAHRNARKSDWIEQKTREIARFGPLTARLLWWAPWITGGVQFVSFVTSFLGIRIILGLNQENRTWFSHELRMPTFLHGMTETIHVNIMSNDVLAVSISLFMAVMIWFMSTICVGRVREQQPVSIGVLVLIFFLGTISTYTAFFMWNGEVSTRAEFKQALRETEAYLSDIEQVDKVVIGNAEREIKSEQAQLESQQLGMRITALDAYLQDLKGHLDDQNQRFADISSLPTFLEARGGFYRKYEKCERDIGCLSNLGGRGEVVKQLEQNVQTFDENYQSWARLSQSRESFTQIGSEAVNRAAQHLAVTDLQGAEVALADVRNSIIKAEGEDPSVIIESVKSQLGIPISIEAPTESQQQALTKLQEGVDNDLRLLASLEANWVDKELVLPPLVSVAEIGSELSLQVGILSNVIATMEQVIESRQSEFRSLRDDLVAIEETIQIRVTEDLLLQTADSVFLDINRLRDKALALTTTDLTPIMARLQLVPSYQSDGAANIPNLETQYPSIADFEPTPLPILILDYAHLSAPTLAVQILLDFGYTLVLVLTVASLLGSRKPKSSVEAQTTGRREKANCS